jgi:hypothetical protein
MAKNFGRVNVSISASTGALTKGLKSASSQMQSFSGQIKSINSRMGTLVFMQGAQMFAGFVRGVSSAVRSLISMGQAQAGVIDSNAKLSRRLGVTYKELAGLSLAGDLAGVSMDQIGAAMTKADVLMTKAAGGSKAAQDAFGRLGLNIASLQGMSGADRFEAIAAAIGQLPTAAERSAAAVALFGRSGAQLLPLFEGGAAGIAQARAEAEKFGLALTGQQARSVEAMNDAFTRVRAAISGVVGQVTAYLAPAIEGIAKTFTDFVGSVGGANIGQAIGDALLDGAEFLAGVGDYIIANFGPTLQSVFDYLSKVGAQWNAVFGFANRIAAAFTGAFQLLQSAGSAIGLVFFRAVEQLAKAGAAIASVIPGGGNAEKFLKSVQSGAGEFGDAYAKATEDSFKKSMANFNKAIYGDKAAEEAGQAIATPLTDAVKGFRQTAREAAAAIDEAVDKPAQVQTAVEVSSKELKAIVAGSSGGESFRNALMRGADPRNTANTAEQETADNTGEAVDLLEDLPAELASVMNSQFGLATISA